MTIISLVVLGLGFLHFYVPRFITEIKNPLIEFMNRKNLSTDRLSFAAHQLNGKQISFISEDNVELEAYLTYSSSDTVKGTIILLHGIRSNKESFIELSKMLSNEGYNAVAMDLRAHGESGGTHCTFGVKERKDISRLIDFLNTEEGITKNIGVWGKSLGGGIGLQAIGSDKRIRFGIIESTFSDFETITHDYFKLHLGFNIAWFTNYLVSRSGKIAGFDPSDARPVKYCEKIDQPILIVHGNKDDRIDIKYGRENFSEITSRKKEFVEIDGANHLNVWEVGGEDYFESVMSFIFDQTKVSNSNLALAY